MDDAERRQRVIGLVTQVYYARRDGKDPYDPEVSAGLSALVEGFGAYDLQKSVEFPQTQETFQVLVAACVQEAADQVGLRAFRAFSEMISLFCDFAQYAEQAAPQLDVSTFLRQAAFRAASDE